MDRHSQSSTTAVWHIDPICVDCVRAHLRDVCTERCLLLPTHKYLRSISQPALTRVRKRKWFTVIPAQVPKNTTFGIYPHHNEAEHESDPYDIDNNDGWRLGDWVNEFGYNARRRLQERCMGKIHVRGIH